MILPNPWVIIGVSAAFMASVGGSYLYGVSSGRASEKAAQTASELAQTKAVLTGFENAALAMNGLAGQYTQIAQGLSTEIDALSGRFRNAARAAPLDPVCKPDPVRVQFLTEAIAATNTAIGRGASPAVPPAP